MGVPVKEPFVVDEAEEAMIARARADGSLIREKAKAILEHFGIPELLSQLRDPESGRAHKLDVIKYLSKLSDVDPKQAVATGSGEKFTINIAMPAPAAPGVSPALPPITIDAQPVPPPPEPAPMADPLPQGFPVPGFKLDMNLVGYAPAVPPTGKP